MTKSMEEGRLRLNNAQNQECVEESNVDNVWVKTDDMLADCLTKRGGKTNNLIDAGVLSSIQEANKAGVHLVTDIAKVINEDIGDDY